MSSLEKFSSVGQALGRPWAGVRQALGGPDPDRDPSGALNSRIQAANVSTAIIASGQEAVIFPKSLGIHPKIAFARLQSSKGFDSLIVKYSLNH